MKVRTLKGISHEEVVACMLLAFENYYVKMPTDKEYYRKRWKAAKVDFSLCYGMFDQEKLIACMIHGIDTRYGQKIAFNTGTGVIPKHRGKRVVKSMYNFALTDLKNKGIEKSALEVIKENEKAIRAYKSVGFEIVKSYSCFAGSINIDDIEEVELKEVDKDEFNWSETPNQALYSWDFQKETITNLDYKYYQVICNETPESYFIINPENKYLAQFDVLEKQSGAWNRLLKGINQVSADVKIINLDDRLEDKHAMIKKAGLKNTVNQYEMELVIHKDSKPS